MISKSEIKFIRSLAQKKYRQENNLFVVEGERLVSEVINSTILINKLLITDSFLNNLSHRNTIININKKGIVFVIVDDKEMKSISDTINPSGILTICEMPQSNTLNLTKLENWLYLEEIQDPGNLGTLLRSANWFGVKNIALSEHCSDVYNPKVLRGGMGSHFHLNIFSNIDISLFNNSQYTVIGAFQNGKNIDEIDVNQLKPWVLVIGNEARGISSEISNNINLKVTIPKIGIGESLNAAVAGSILLNHLTKLV